MNIRLMGSPDLVRAWASTLENHFGVKGGEYPTRGGGTDIRWYVDLDDRKAVVVVAAFGIAMIPVLACVVAVLAVAITIIQGLLTLLGT